MARKRKTTYPPPKTATRPAARPGAGPESGPPRPGLVAIDTTAGGGRTGLTIGDRVRIAGSGLYAGEIAVIEKLVGTVVPAALVRTESGRSRQVRTIDLEPVRAEG